ncbi:hypothetical protein GY12_02595 [Micrococcus luteus]|nr:hypothetical protein GY12_02595 [Micrococcus luteus]
MERLRTLGGEGEQARLTEAVKAALQVGMALERGVFVIVQAGAAQALVVQLEASGSIRCSWQPLLAHSLIMLPVLGGISG